MFSIKNNYLFNSFKSYFVSQYMLFGNRLLFKCCNFRLYSAIIKFINDYCWSFSHVLRLRAPSSTFTDVLLNGNCSSIQLDIHRSFTIVPPSLQSINGFIYNPKDHLTFYFLIVTIQDNTDDTTVCFFTVFKRHKIVLNLFDK